MAINDVKIDREQEHQKRGDNLGREFNLTYRDTLLDDERIIAGGSLYQKDWHGAAGVGPGHGAQDAAT